MSSSEVNNVITQVSRDQKSKKDDFAYFNYFNFLCCMPDKTPIFNSVFQSDDEEKPTPYPGKKTPALSVQQRKDYLLPYTHGGRKTLVLDLDETLVHSTFKATTNCSFTVDINISGKFHTVYVLKRPGVDEFLKECAKHFELVIFTASLSNYADAVMDVLDADQLIPFRLFRQHCVQINGT
jgi:TFIIF-interacting CTD phosphatase-like protein